MPEMGLFVMPVTALTNADLALLMAGVDTS